MSFVATSGVDLTGLHSTTSVTDPASPSQFRFSFTPAQSLTAATPVTLTLSPFPLGITVASSNNHYLRITDGIGGNENVLITARTSTTITFTPASNHSSSNWTIQSASYGIQEAIRWTELQPNGGSVLLERGNSQVYQKIFFSGVPAVNIFGQGLWGSQVVQDASYAGDVFYCSNSTIIISFHDVHIGAAGAPASGAGIHFIGTNVAGAQIVNCKVTNTFKGLDIENCDGVRVENFYYEQAQSGNPNVYAGIHVRGARGTNLLFRNGYILCDQVDSPNMMDYGIRLDAADGVAISGFLVRAETGISVIGSSGITTGIVTIEDNIVDSCRFRSLELIATGAPTFFGDFNIIGNQLTGIMQVGAGQGRCLFAQTASAATEVRMNVIGNLMTAARVDGCDFINMTGVNVVGNTIVDNNSSSNSNGCGIQLQNTSDVVITGNRISNTAAIANAQRYGIILVGTAANLVISDNILRNNYSQQIANFTAPTGSIIRSNIGQDEIIPTIASATTITIPDTMPTTIIISGTTPIATIAGPWGTGQRLTLLFEGAVNLTNAGNISRAFGPTVAGQKVELEWVGATSKWYPS